MQLASGCTRGMDSWGVLIKIDTHGGDGHEICNTTLPVIRDGHEIDSSRVCFSRHLLKKKSACRPKTVLGTSWDVNLSNGPSSYKLTKSKEKSTVHGKVPVPVRYAPIFIFFNDAVGG